MSLDTANLVGEVLGPIGLDPNEVMLAAGYTTLRALAVARMADTGGDPSLKPYWLPTDDQLSDLRNEVAPRVPFLVAKKRLSTFANDEPSLDSLDDHQIDMFTTASRLICGEDRAIDSSVCIVAATSSGKTHMMFKFVEALHHKTKTTNANEPVEDSNQRTLVLVDTNRLLKQTIEKAQELVPSIEVGQYNMFNKDLSKPVTVMTYSSFIRATKEGVIKKGDFGAVLLDEADKALAPDTRVEVKDFASEGVMCGFTATGKYSDRRHVGMLFENVVEDYDIKKCVEIGVASPVQVWLVRTGEKLDIGGLKRFGDIPKEKLEELGQRAHRGLLSVKITRDLVSNGMKGLVKCPPGDRCSFAILRAEQLNNTLITDNDGNTRRIRAEAVGSGIKDSQKYIDMYKNGELDVLCYVKVIGRGFDDVDTEFFVDESPTLSPVEGTQGPGRVMRRKDGKIAQIIHLLDEITSDGKPVRAYTMLHALGAEEYEPGMYFGPSDRWRGNDKRYERKPYEHLQLFSHEVFDYIRRLNPDVRRSQGFGAYGAEGLDLNVPMSTKAELAQATGLTTNVVGNFLRDNNIDPQSMGRARYYDSRYAGVIKDWDKIRKIKKPDPEKLGWMHKRSFGVELLREIGETHPFLKPISVVSVSGYNPSFLSPTQVEAFKAVVGDGVETVYLRQDRDRAWGREEFWISGSDAKILGQLDKTKSPFDSNIFTTVRQIKERTLRNWKDAKITEIFPRVLAVTHGSTLLRTMAEGKQAIQTAYDDVAEGIGIKSRVINLKNDINSPDNYGYYIKEAEKRALVAALSASTRYLDYSRERIDDTKEQMTGIDCALAFQMIDLVVNWGISDKGTGSKSFEEYINFYIDMYRQVFALEADTKLLSNPGYYSNHTMHVLQTVPIVALQNALTATARKHGLDGYDQTIDRLVKYMAGPTTDRHSSHNEHTSGDVYSSDVFFHGESTIKH